MPDRDVHPRSSPFLRAKPPSTRLSGSTVTWLVGLGLVGLVVLSVLGENGFGQYLRLRGQRDGMRQDLESIRRQTERLEADLEALKTEPLALEKLARERYNMRREGEEVILLRTDRGESSRRP